MTIVIAGIKRSGSTLLYNAVRLCLEHAGMDYEIYGETTAPENYQGDVNLVKIHRFKQNVAEAADHVFITNRNYNDAKASLERFNGQEQSWERFVLFYRWLMRWSLYSTPAHYFEYKQLTEDLSYCIQMIADVLDVEWVALENVEYELRNLEPPESGQDPVTLLFSNHITQ